MASTRPSGSKADSGGGASADLLASGAEPTPTTNSTSKREDEPPSAETQRSPKPPKRYLTLSPPLSTQEIPQHEELGLSSGNDSGGNPKLEDFVKHMLDEVKAQTWDISSFKKTGTHSFGSKSKAAGIEVGQYVQDVGGETWFARLSKHSDDDSALKSWRVFDKVVRKEHSKHEGEYTPNIYDVNTILSWTGPELEGLGVKDVQVEVTNMYHGIPAPLNDRVFSVLVVSGVRTDLSSSDEAKEESFVVQLPVDITSLPSSITSRCHHQSKNGNLTYNPPSEAITEANKAKVGKKLVQGVYASVEKLTKIGEETLWFMATTSDAKGVLPGWVQKKAVPGEVVKDVEYVYGYIEKHKGELKG